MLQNGRSKIEQSPGLLSIVVPSRKNWFAIIFVCIWMGGWYMGFKSAFGMLWNGKSNPAGVDMFMLIWLAGWTFGGVAIVFFVLWMLFGKEKFHAENGVVIFQKSILGIGVRRKLDLAHVKSPRTEVENGSILGRNRWAFWGMGPGKIKFDYGMKTYSFGLGVDDAEAVHIVNLLSEFLKGAAAKSYQLQS